MLKKLLSICAIIYAMSNIYAGNLPYFKKNDSTQKMSDLIEAYVSTSPENLKDGLLVGEMNVKGTSDAVKAIIADDKAGKYDKLDSLLLWKDGKLIFEMYTRKGRVDLPHYTMSVTKTVTSMLLARFIQLGLLKMGDLDKPIIDFMPEIDRSKIQPGVDGITLRDALFMKSGIRFKTRNLDRRQSGRKQEYFQALFENTKPVSAETKKYKYTGFNPSMIMMILDIKSDGNIQKFIKDKFLKPLGITNYSWANQGCGIPNCGAGSHFTSRDLLKFGITVINGGKYHGEQLFSPEYVNLINDRNKGEGYFYYFHNRAKMNSKKKVDFISGIGAGGQYISLFPDQNIVIVATSSKSKIKAPLTAMLQRLMPLFSK